MAKRDPALVSLSHEHHRALFVSLAMRRATDADAEKARAAFGEYWETIGERHFEAEEQVLLPAYAEFGDPHGTLVVQALGDHVELRHRGRTVLAAPTPVLDDLHALATRLTEHVRLEERQLFPLIEREVPAERMVTIADELERASGG